jgi:soluble lytic murein transglycosylase-like protein
LDELTISKSAEVTSDCGCPIEWEDYVYQMGEKYGFPGNILMTILYRESGGNFDTNGVISTTNDYGLAQINKCNFDTIYNRLGFSEDEILNDPYKNIEAAALLISDIFKYYNYTTLDYDSANVFGCYNGWSNWRSIESAKNYSNACVEIMNLYYSDDNKCLVRQSN